MKFCGKKLTYGCICCTVCDQQLPSLEMHKMRSTHGNLGVSSGRHSVDGSDEEPISRSVVATLQAREEEIERRKTQVKAMVESQLGRAEEETKRLAGICEELEALADPMGKEVANIRKKIDSANKEVKNLGQSCQKKEREYKEALEVFNEKNKEKVQLVSKLMELVSESEKLRMKKLEELSKNIELMH